MQRSQSSWLVVALLMLVAAALRFPGLDYLLPLVVEPDPHISIQVRLIEEEHPDPNQVEDWAKSGGSEQSGFVVSEEGRRCAEPWPSVVWHERANHACARDGQ